MIILLVLSSSSFASIYNVEECRVVKVIDDNHFEEGLSTHEYPTIGVTREPGRFEVSVGAMRDWELQSGDYVAARVISTKSAVYRFRYRDGRSTYTFVVDTNSKGRRFGKLYVKEAGAKHSLIAVAYCRSK